MQLSLNSFIRAVSYRDKRVCYMTGKTRGTIRSLRRDRESNYLIDQTGLVLRRGYREECTDNPETERRAFKVTLHWGQERVSEQIMIKKIVAVKANFYEDVRNRTFRSTESSIRIHCKFLKKQNRKVCEDNIVSTRDSTWLRNQDTNIVRK